MIPVIPYTVDKDGNVQKNGGAAICPFQTKLVVQNMAGQNVPKNSTCNIMCPMCNVVVHQKDGDQDVFEDGTYLEISCSGTVGYYKIGELEKIENKSSNLKSVK